MPDIGRMLFDLFILFAAARIGGAVFVLLRQPAVVGEILAGILIGPHILGMVGDSPMHEVFAELGVVFLLFIVGLETQPRSLLQVGRQAASVGAAGVIVPFLGGLLLMRGLGRPLLESLFVGTALTATSVGITARVMADLGVLHTRVARVILGAAVFDDILGMLVLAVVSGLAAGTLSMGQISLLTGESIAFCLLAFYLGRHAVRRLSPPLSAFAEASGRDAVFAVAMMLCFAFSAFAESIGLAAIIGAFLAGIIFAEIPDAPRLQRSMQPIYELLVPIFFVLTGVRVDLHRLLTPDVLPVGLLITLIAILGKLIGCGAAALPLGRKEALTIGIGMAPRGEVGIVVALIGLSRGVMSHDIYAQIVLMSVLTSLFAPPLLRMLLVRQSPLIPDNEQGQA
ncbi:MAG: cation:proton antiporter [Armatimonadota bacterium]|jgi:Kef-type K+ transport system membrane component KefB